MIKHKTFKVVSRSENANSFGLHGLVVVARDGEAWEIAANSIYDKQQGTSVYQNIDNPKNPTFDGYELPRKLPQCPKDVVAEIYKTNAPTNH